METTEQNHVAIALKVMVLAGVMGTVNGLMKIVLWVKSLVVQSQVCMYKWNLFIGSFKKAIDVSIFQMLKLFTGK